jgi:RLL motif-containing protein 1
MVENIYFKLFFKNSTLKQLRFLKDKALNEAAKILRLLHIKELRELQTRINETIVNIQKITANPKTDSSLGRVGK